MSDDRLAAWDRVHKALALLSGWRVSPPRLHEEARRWHMTAHDGRRHGRGKVHESIDAVGATETQAIEALARQLENRAGRT
jgi:hypothetical protein